MKKLLSEGPAISVEEERALSPAQLKRCPPTPVALELIEK